MEEKKENKPLENLKAERERKKNKAGNIITSQKCYFRTRTKIKYFMLLKVKVINTLVSTLKYYIVNFFFSIECIWCNRVPSATYTMT